KKADSWEEKAMEAVKAGREDLAMEALGKKREHQQAADLYDDQLETQRIAVDELKRALGELVAKLEDTKRRRNLLIARAKRAEAQRHLAVTLSAAHENSASERLERLEARIEKEEAEAEATWEVAALSPGGYDQDLSAEIAQLSAGTPGDDLAALKAKMQQMGPGSEGAKALPSRAGKKTRSEADLAAEIAEAAGEDLSSDDDSPTPPSPPLADDENPMPTPEDDTGEDTTPAAAAAAGDVSKA
ncbi:MAG: PspA/IM30 family protein, partial [Myxococcota bacterium]